MFSHVAVILLSACRLVHAIFPFAGYGFRYRVTSTLSFHKRELTLTTERVRTQPDLSRLQVRVLLREAY